MKTLLFTLEYPPFKGGVANYYGNLVKYWPLPDNIFVLNNNDGKLINKPWPILKWLPAILELKKAIKKNKIEHIIIGHILPLGTVALICSRFCKIKYSVILHGMDFTCAVKSYRKKFVTKLISEQAEKIICANTYTAELVKNFLPKVNKNKIVTVNPGVENRITHNSSGFARSGEARQPALQLKEKYNLANKIVLLSVGRLVKRKGFDKVIEALPEILKQAPNLVYVIIGDGSEIENWKLKIGNLGLKKHVKIINQVTDEERDNWYNASDIFVMPARNIDGDFEGFGIVYLEANLAGKPVIAGRSGGVGDAVVNGLNGLLVNPENTNEISQAVIKLAQDTDLRHKLGEQGKRRAINDFNWKKQVEKISKFIM